MKDDRRRLYELVAQKASGAKCNRIEIFAEVAPRDKPDATFFKTLASLFKWTRQ